MALVRAIPLLDFLSTARSTTASGTAVSTEAPVLGQTLVGALHLTCGSATTSRVLAASVQSASSSGFGSLTTELTFTLTSSEGSDYQSLASPSTDRPWRRARLVMSTAASTAGSWKGLIWMGLKS